MPNPGSFLPSGDAFAFTNAWPAEPAIEVPTPFGKIGIGNAASGLCGGMVFAALDYWHAGIAPPQARVHAESEHQPAGPRLLPHRLLAGHPAQFLTGRPVRAATPPGRAPG